MTAEVIPWWKRPPRGDYTDSDNGSYMAGYNAGISGESILSNPWGKHLVWHGEWEKGFREGESRRELARVRRFR